MCYMFKSSSASYKYYQLFHSCCYSCRCLRPSPGVEPEPFKPPAWREFCTSTTQLSLSAPVAIYRPAFVPYFTFYSARKIYLYQCFKQNAIFHSQTIRKLSCIHQWLCNQRLVYSKISYTLIILHSFQFQIMHYFNLKYPDYKNKISS